MEGDKGDSRRNSAWDCGQYLNLICKTIATCHQRVQRKVESVVSAPYSSVFDSDVKNLQVALPRRGKGSRNVQILSVASAEKVLQGSEC